VREPQLTLPRSPAYSFLSTRPMRVLSQKPKSAGFSVVSSSRRGASMAKAFSLEPLEDRIVVRPLEEAQQKTPSGIIIPDTAKEKPQEGEVVAVGPGRFEEGKRVPMDVAVGDKVIYPKYGGTEVKVDGEEYLVLTARDVLAKVKE